MKKTLVLASLLLSGCAAEPFNANKATAEMMQASESQLHLQCYFVEQGYIPHSEIDDYLDCNVPSYQAFKAEKEREQAESEARRLVLQQEKEHKEAERLAAQKQHEAVLAESERRAKERAERSANMTPAEKRTDLEIKLLTMTQLCSEGNPVACQYIPKYKRALKAL